MQYVIGSTTLTPNLILLTNMGAMLTAVSNSKFRTQVFLIRYSLVTK